MEMVNPLAAFRQGWDTSQGIFDARTQRQAGNALAQGDYRGGANALLQGGMLEDGMQVQAYDAKRQQQAVEAQREADKVAAADKVRRFEVLGRGVQALKTGQPWEQVRQQLVAIDPAMAEFVGLVDQELQAGRIQLTPEGLDAFSQLLGVEVEKAKVQAFQSGGTAVGVNTETGKEVWRNQITAPPQGEWKEVGGNLWFFPADGSRPQKGEATTPKPKTYAPARPRSGGGGSAAPSGGSRSYGNDPSGPQW